MGIYIPNMEMPKTCQICRTAKFDRIVGCEEWDRLSIAQRMYMRSETCPLVPLLEGHGRLGDLDALSKEFERLAFLDWNQKAAPYNWAYAYSEAQAAVDDAPTIVPAEGGNADVQCL